MLIINVGFGKVKLRSSIGGLGETIGIRAESGTQMSFILTQQPMMEE